ncbi:sodium:solute symporter, partial [Streptomyces canus]
TAFVLNVVVTVVLTFVLKALKAPDGVDETSPQDYTADAAQAEATAAPALRPGTSPAPNPS